jgi:anti-sigma regulatory factor (Ser/Thr protein kinase)
VHDQRDCEHLLPPISYARPPQGHRTTRTWHLASTRDLAGMRAGVAKAVSGGTSKASLDELVLIVSELATNALRHGGGTATVHLGVDDESYLLQVVDQAPESPPHVAADRGTGDGGFGLVLALGVAREVGWYRTESSKVVWSVHDAPASP